MKRQHGCVRDQGRGTQSEQSPHVTREYGLVDRGANLALVEAQTLQRPRPLDDTFATKTR
jgi:hypothetical protein